MNVTVNDAIADIDAEDWNRLVRDGCPMSRHEFLLAGERSGSVAPESGWTPRHLTCRRDDRVVGAMPLYEKSHSWGEFVFDWSWARAYEQAGLDYYPKLVSALPFTPASSRRLLLAEDAGDEVAKALLDAAIALADESGASSLHILFPTQSELQAMLNAGLRVRKDCQFHWHNRDYESFDDFLATFSSSKRKKARRERRRVSEAGITFRHLYAGEIDLALWNTLYQLISITFMRRGSLPYFNLDFFLRLGGALPDNVLAVIAEQGSDIIAAALFFESSDVLYGRYWGSDGYYDALHFETCYYQGIEHCIRTGKRLFEPGTQGEHKISRGFVPSATWSAHWLQHPEFFSAIAAYLDAEKRQIERYMEEVDAHSPYRNEPG